MNDYYYLQYFFQENHIRDLGKGKFSTWINFSTNCREEYAKFFESFGMKAKPKRIPYNGLDIYYTDTQKKKLIIFCKLNEIDIT